MGGGGAFLPEGDADCVGVVSFVACLVGKLEFSLVVGGAVLSMRIDCRNCSRFLAGGSHCSFLMVLACNFGGVFYRSFLCSRQGNR